MLLQLSMTFLAIEPIDAIWSPTRWIEAFWVALSDRYRMVAGVAAAVTFGSGFVLPVSVPRLPFGLGGMAVEAEAVDNVGQQ